MNPRKTPTLIASPLLEKRSTVQPPRKPKISREIII